MILSRYWPMVRDLGGIVSTVAGQGGNGSGALPYAPGQAARAVSRFHAARLEGHVLAARPETPDTRTLRLAFGPATLPPFMPGQHFTLHVTMDGFETSRPYTVTSTPGWGDILEVTVKRHPLGLVSPYLVDRLAPGDPVLVSGPDGNDHFNPLRDTDELVLLAGGSGITAFMTTVERLLATRPQTCIQLLYGNRTEADIIFRERLEGLAASHPDRFDLRLVLSRPPKGWSGDRGHVDGDYVRRAALRDGPDNGPDNGEALARKTFFVCGPPAMNRQLPAALLALGVRPRRLHAASPALPTPDMIVQIRGWPTGVTSRDTFTVQHGRSGKRLQARAGESVLQALERAGATNAASCRTGVCGACRERLVSGEVFAAPGFEPRPTDSEAGYIHTCVCFPVSDLTLNSA